MTPHSVRLYEGVSDPRTVTPGTAALSAVASIDARSAESAPTAQHPVRPAPFLRLVHDHIEEPQPDALDQIALVTMMCEMRHMKAEIADLQRKVRDINHREAV